MGLAAAKNKRKLGSDPNNTKWSRKTDSFGQKILRAQGWQPGQYLGAKDAPHAEWHTEANSSHIRVVLKDDNLGLGAKRNNGDECTGLDAFQHLLGRLNGKSEEALETERKAREEVKLSLYVERKLGTIRFVRGGWLVGDQVKDKPDGEEPASEVPKEHTEESSVSEPAKLKSKKRKIDHDTGKEDDKARKKEKKSKKRKAESEAEVDSDNLRERKENKSKKRRSRSEEGDAESSATSESSGKLKTAKDEGVEKFGQSVSGAVSETCGSLDEAEAEAKKAKKEKKHRKKDKKEKAKKDRAPSDSGAETGDSIAKEKKRRKDGSNSKPLEEAVTESPAPTPADSTPSGSGYSTPVPTGTSRYLARSKFIAQKRMALADNAALNQIFMIKS
ncbi:hypothetical protein VTK56DRAFT_9172 [Thermocarpiscus australiensis]